MSKRLPNWQENKEATPVLVYNPYTEKTINIEPFFRFVRSFGCVDGCLDVADMIVRSHAMAPAFEDFDLNDYEQRRLELDFLFQLKDTFSNLKECEISTPKKR